MTRITFLILLIACNSPKSVNRKLNSSDILARSIEYHDPQGNWSKLQQVLEFKETRPNGADRQTTVVIDNQRSYFKLNRNNEEIHGMRMDSCFLEKGDADCSRIEMLRNYYLYLWGLPMKLTDESTNLSNSVSETSYNGVRCYELKVTYDEDEWSYFFDVETYRMIAYMFYKPRGGEKGEYILLENEIEVQGMKIPQNRSWYTLPDSSYLGTDILISGAAL